MKYEEPKITFSYWEVDDVMASSTDVLKDDWDGFDPDWLL